MFSFDVPLASFHNKLTSYPHPKVINLSLSDFCKHILGPIDPPEAYAKVTHFARYQHSTGWRHQFVVFRAELRMDRIHINLWFRVERTPDRTSRAFRHRRPSTVIFPANDKVCTRMHVVALVLTIFVFTQVQISLRFNELFEDFDLVPCILVYSNINATSSEMGANLITIGILAKALETFCEASKNYVFYSVSEVPLSPTRPYHDIWIPGELLVLGDSDSGTSSTYSWLLLGRTNSY